jgi:hypothetical protein
MKSRDVAAFLAELERRLTGVPGRRAEVVAEIAEHLGDLVAEAVAEGADVATAEARAVARFGSPRRLARGLGARRRTPRGARLALALGLLALSGGFAYAQLRPTSPVVALAVATHSQATAGGSGVVTVLGRSRLVALDPVTLRVVRNGPALTRGNPGFFDWLPPDMAFVSPDGLRMALVSNAGLQIFDLGDLRQTATVALGVHPLKGPSRPSQRAGSMDVIRTGAWLGQGVVALLQHQAPPYASRITRREIVVIDPSSGRVLSRRLVALKGAVIATARSGGHEVVLACAAGRASLLDIRAGGSGTLTQLDLPCTADGLGVGLAGDGSSVAIVEAGQPLVLVDLRTHLVRSVELHGSLGWSGVKRAELAAAWWQGRLIVTGASVATTKRGAPRYPGVGVTAIDPRTGESSVWTRDGNWFVPTAAGLAVGGPGLGLTNFSSDGKRLWHVEGRRTVWPYAVGGTVFAPHSVQRHTIVDAFSLRTGRLIGSSFQAGNGTRPFAGVIPAVG